MKDINVINYYKPESFNEILYLKNIAVLLRVLNGLMSDNGNDYT